MMQPKPRQVILLSTAPFCLALLTLWQISEMDLFWMIRAGQEIISTSAIPDLETWTYTVPGTEWVNTHWLSELLSYLLFAAGGEPALVAGRALLALLLLLMTALLASAPDRCRAVDNAAIPPQGFSGSWAAGAAAAAGLYLTSWFRLEWRADTFVLICFGLLLVIARSTYRKKRLAYALLVLLAANFHAGSAVFLLVTALLLVLGERGLQPGLKAAWSLALAAAFLATPVHVKVIPFIMQHFFYSSGQVLGNPDHRPLGLQHFLSPQLGWAGLFWAALTATGLAGAWLSLRRRTAGDPAPSRWTFVLPLALGLTALSLNRDRAIPYQMLFLAPYIGTALRQIRPRARISLVLVLGLACAVQRTQIPMPFGFVVNAEVFPVRSTAFLGRVRPAGNIYHTFTFGAYLVWYLRDYRIFGDTRETPFKALATEYLAAYRDPAYARMHYDRYRVNTLLMPIPGTEFIPGRGHRDVLEEYNPRAEWALVYFDRMSVVTVRRIPAHETLIREHEYAILRPNLPVDHYVRSAERSPEHDRRFVAEIARCLGEDPANPYCLGARAAWNDVR